MKNVSLWRFQIPERKAGDTRGEWVEYSIIHVINLRNIEITLNILLLMKI